MSKRTSPIDRARKDEIRRHTSARRQIAGEAAREIRALGKQADALLRQARKVAARAGERDRIFARRIQILETRLS